MKAPCRDKIKQIRLDCSRKTKSTQKDADIYSEIAPEITWCHVKP